MPTRSFLAPFTVIDRLYKDAFDLYLANVIGAVEAALAAPLLACVTLWVIVQGILVMRGDIDTRRGLTKMITVALVVGLVSSGTLYHDYIADLFGKGIPDFVRQLGGNFGLPAGAIPVQLDIVLKMGEIAFQKVAAEVSPLDQLDSVALEGAQFFFYFSLWSIFGVYHIIGIMTSLLVSVGPLFVIGFLFETTMGMASRWIGQLVSYAILLLLVSIVASIVISVIVLSAGTMFLLAIGRGTLSAQVIGLYELDLFIMTGNALVVAVPAIAANIGGGVAASGGQIGQSIFRRFARYERPQPATTGPSQNIQALGGFVQ